MNKEDIIKTYNPKYYDFEKKDGYNLLKIFHNYEIIYTLYNYSAYLKIKIIKQNYIIRSYFNYNENKNTIDKIKNYDNTKININDHIDYDDYNFDLKITDNGIIKKIDNNIYILYFYKKYIIKDNNIKAIRIRQHNFFNSKYYYIKYYNTYNINYCIIIYNSINKNYTMYNAYNYNTIFCNFSRNFMIII